MWAADRVVEAETKAKCRSNLLLALAKKDDIVHLHELTAEAKSLGGLSPTLIQKARTAKDAISCNVLQGWFRTSKVDNVSQRKGRKPFGSRNS